MLKIAYSPIYKYQLPEGHRFPMIKYELVPEQLLYEGSIQAENFFHPSSMREARILRVHTADYWEKLKHMQLSRREERNIGFPVRAELIERGRHIAQGTLDCTKHARTYGVAMNVAGGTHHAFADQGAGFCVFNDQALAAQYLLDEALARQILIIDLDVHQGDGTAHIFQEEKRVYTFSMHGARNYPTRKQNSDWDIGWPDGTEDEAYLARLAEVLPKLFEQVEPDFVFYLAGVDVLATDKLGRLAMSKSGCKQRDRMVFEACKHANVPVVVSMGGGYSEKISDIVDAHANTFRLAQEIYF